MSKDTIYRQDAIEALDDVENWVNIGNEDYILLAEAVDSIRALSSAEPERKKGFWYALEKGDKGYSASDFKCSVCGEPNHTWLTKPNYCPNCGAKMEG